MIDTSAARNGIELLSTIIGELMEDSAAQAVMPARHKPLQLAADLGLVGADVAALAAAIEVLARRSSRAR